MTHVVFTYRIRRDHTGVEDLMPVILTEAEEAVWLAPINNDAEEKAIKQLMKPYPTDAMTAVPVRPLLGKDGSGNTERACDPFMYPELLLADPLA